MKNLLLSTLLVLAFCFESKAQLSIDNLTNCEIVATQYCFDLCSLGNTNVYVIPVGGSIPIASCISHPVVSEVWEVCWLAPNDQCGNDPVIPCVTVDGENAQGCGPGTYTDIIQYCDICVPSTGGVATVTYTPGVGLLIQ